MVNWPNEQTDCLKCPWRWWWYFSHCCFGFGFPGKDRRKLLCRVLRLEVSGNPTNSDLRKALRKEIMLPAPEGTLRIQFAKCSACQGYPRKSHLRGGGQALSHLREAPHLHPLHPCQLEAGQVQPLAFGERATPSGETRV
jgi:hypothetical protein